MGQYHYVANLEKREYVDPNGIGSGLKAWEQAMNLPGTPIALFLLTIAQNGRGGGDFNPELNWDIEENPDGVIGRWAGDRIAIIGDYWEPSDEIALKNNLHGLWDTKGEDWLDITVLCRECMNGCGLGGKYEEKTYDFDPTYKYWSFVRPEEEQYA